MEFPNKYFFTIGDVSRLTKIKPHVLRYWEEQFKVLRPARRYSGHRKYTQREIDLINKIRFLIVEKKFTISGAKREINRTQQQPAKPSLSRTSNVAQASMPILRDIKNDVEECLQILSPKPETADLN